MLERRILLAVIALAGSPALLRLRRVGGLLAQSLAPLTGSYRAIWAGWGP